MIVADLLLRDGVVGAIYWIERMIMSISGRGKQRLAPSAIRLAGRFCRDTGGAMAIMMALLIPMVIGMMGLTVDVGIWYVEKRGLQNIADAAALAGGSELANGASDADVRTAATADANRNDLVAATDFLDINIPPESGPNAGNDSSVEVILTRQMPLFFTTAFFKLIGQSTTQFNATARAVVNTSFVDEFCILGLDDTASKAVEIGSADVTLDCGIAVNSDADNALFVSGNADLTTTSVTTVGQTSIIGGGVLNSDAPPRRGSEVDDPYSDLEIPDFFDCDLGSIGGGNTGTTVTGSETLDAAGGIMVLCGGLKVSAGGDLTLEPGVYIIDSGDFIITGGGSIEGDGVTIILTSSVNDDSIGSFSVTGNGDVSLSAPTDDPVDAPGFSGVLFFQDSKVSTNPSKKNLFAGGAELDLEGVLYFPSQSLEFQGGSDIGSGCTQLVAKKVTITGDAVLETNCNDSGTRAIGRLKATLGE